MQQLKFLCVTQDNAQLCADFSALMFPYSEELDEDLDEKLPAEILQKWIDSILRMQGDSDRHLELCYDGDALIGFLYGKVDHPEHRGYIKPGTGTSWSFMCDRNFAGRAMGRSYTSGWRSFSVRTAPPGSISPPEQKPESRFGGRWVSLPPARSAQRTKWKFMKKKSACKGV